MSDTFDIEAERLRLETLGDSFHVEDFQFSGVTLYRVRILFKGEEIDETRSCIPEKAIQKAIEGAKEHE